MYPWVFFDAQRVKIREDAVARNKAVDLALGILLHRPSSPCDFQGAREGDARYPMPMFAKV